ncbi:MAG: hypothetical protein PHY93_09130 [Bacteriovorax sp.]|nr:hypothetical protein [Bacteriovorax sp.]
MKNWLYIPFLVLMAVTYSRVSENFSGISEESLKETSRAPASVEMNFQEECLDLPSRFNSHFQAKMCF